MVEQRHIRLNFDIFTNYNIYERMYITYMFLYLFPLSIY